jgi:hypothetical protein
VSHRADGPQPKVPFALILIGFVLLAGGLLAWRMLAGGGDEGGGDEASAPGSPVELFPETVVPSTPAGTLAPSPEPQIGDPGQPIDPDHPGLTTLRGNWQRNFFGIGPVPLHPKVAWKVGPWCGRSVDLGEARTWCGTGWNGQPNVIPQPNGSTEVRIGGYDYAYHFLDGETGQPTRPEFRTGDLAKGSATSDPDGCPLYYVGSRDNRFRILGLDRGKPRELWSMTAKTPSEGGKWNDDWDGAAQVVGDYMLVGGEDSWFRIVRLNKRCNGDQVSVNPKIVFETPGWDEQMLSDLQGNQSVEDISIENSVAYDPKRQVAYFGNGGGLVQGYDISGILKGGTSAKRVFRYWMGGENDASIVVADDGDIIASSHYEPPNPHAQATGQLVRLDPVKKGNPLVWKLRESADAGGEAGVFSTPALVGDTLFATANGGRFMGIDAETGEVYWSKQLAPPLWSGPAVVGGVAVLGDCSGTLYGFDVSKPRKQPKELWRLPLGGCLESTPAIWDGWIYVGTRAGYEYGITDKHLDRLRRAWEKNGTSP